MNSFLSAIVAMTSVALSMSAQLRPRDRFPITTDQVAAKLVTSFAEKGVILDATRIELPTAVTATEESPALEVRSVENLGTLRGAEAASTSSAVKLACTKSSVCLPFYAVVTQTGLDGGRGLRGVGPDTSVTATPLVKSGAHVTLLVDSGTSHIQMDVVAMQNGALNQQIKVRSADRKQVFSVQILSATAVKGTL